MKFLKNLSIVLMTVIGMSLMPATADSECEGNTVLGNGGCSADCDEGQTATCNSGLFKSSCSCESSEEEGLEESPEKRDAHVFHGEQYLDDYVILLSSFDSMTAQKAANSVDLAYEAYMDGDRDLYNLLVEEHRYYLKHLPKDEHAAVKRFRLELIKNAKSIDNGATEVRHN